MMKDTFYLYEPSLNTGSQALQNNSTARFKAQIEEGEEDYVN
jgi:hypothetical protein